jgi:hypothetical protein
MAVFVRSPSQDAVRFCMAQRRWRLHTGKDVSKRRELPKTIEEYRGDHQRDDEASKKRQLQPENGEGDILPASTLRWCENESL